MDLLDGFFAQYPDFTYNRLGSSPREFYRMCDYFMWRKRPDGTYPPLRVEAQEKLRIAMVQEFNNRFGKDVKDLASWRRICEILQMSPMPSGIEEMKRAVINTHINLSDMLDSKRRGEPIEVFETKDALVQYTIREGRYFPKEDAYAGGLLKYLLREIHNKYKGLRGKRGLIRGEASGRQYKKTGSDSTTKSSR